MHATLPLLFDTTFPAIRRLSLQTLQVNLGYRCNQTCLHCHVNAGPTRKEVMSSQTIDQVFAFLESSGIKRLDLTGGAPELHPAFCEVVLRARSLGVHVIDRCNLTVLEQPECEGFAEFLADQSVEVVASLPCYLERNVANQRGEGTYEASMRVLQRLNALGYGQGSGLLLNLMYNPGGPFLPPPQTRLEADYKRELGSRFNIAFDSLYVLANMPIQRFGSSLITRGAFDGYMKLLKQAHRDENLQTVMCRSLVSVDWRGYVYDCDFNQMLDLPLVAERKQRVHISELTQVALDGNPIVVADHCFGCTAGQGSSCGGALL